MENPTFKAFESCLQIAHFRHLQLELQDLLLVLIMLLTNQSHCLNHSKVFKKTSAMIWYVLINASLYVFFDDITNRIQYRKEKTSTLRPSKEPGGWALLYKTALYWPKGLSSLAWALLEILWKSEIHPFIDFLYRMHGLGAHRVWEDGGGTTVSAWSLSGKKKKLVDQPFANVGSFWRFWNASVSTAIKSCCSETWVKAHKTG